MSDRYPCRGSGRRGLTQQIDLGPGPYTVGKRSMDSGCLRCLFQIVCLYRFRKASKKSACSSQDVASEQLVLPDTARFCWSTLSNGAGFAGIEYPTTIYYGN